MTKPILFALLALCCHSFTHACDIYFDTSSENVRKVLLANGFNLENYDVICQKLQKANASLLISGAAVVLNQRSVGWASVLLKDRKTNISTNEYGGQSTQVDDYASQDRAEELLLSSINDAIETANLDKAIRSLNTARKNTKAAYSR